MKLIVGLGNPGHQYQNTRHNIGFLTVDHLQQIFKLPKFKNDKKLSAEITKNKNLILAKPQTFMNLSGQAVSKIKNYYKIKLTNIMVIHDEIDLPIGKIRLSKNSNAAGNKGIASIIQALKSKNFLRLRIGIANQNKSRIPTDKFVLTPFTKDDINIFKESKIADLTVSVTQDFMDQIPLTKLQNKYN